MLEFGENIVFAHIHDTVYILTVEMECQDGAPGMPGCWVL